MKSTLGRIISQEMCNGSMATLPQRLEDRIGNLVRTVALGCMIDADLRQSEAIRNMVVNILQTRENVIPMADRKEDIA